MARTSWPFSASHTLAARSSPPVTMRRPSGLNATLAHVARVPLEGEPFLAIRGVPHLHRLVKAARDDATAVGAERHAVNRGRVPLEDELLLAILGVPHLGRLVETARDDALAVGAERHAAHPGSAHLEDEPFLAILGVPYLGFARLQLGPRASAVTTRWPSGLNATLFTEAVCPLRTRRSWPVSASHTLAVRSQLPVTIR